MKRHKSIVMISIFCISLMLCHAAHPKEEGGYYYEFANEGRQFYAEKNYLAAAESFKKILSIEPKNKYAKKMLNQCWKKLISEGKRYMKEPFDPKKALRYLTAAKSIDPARARYIDDLIAQVEAKRVEKFEEDSEVMKERMLADVEKVWTTPSIKDLEAKIPTKKKEGEGLDEELKKKLDKKVKVVDFNNASLRDAVKNLSEMTGINIVLDEHALAGIMPEGITIYLADITLPEALEIILKTSGLKYRLEKNYILVTTPDKLVDESSTVRVYDVQDIVGKLYDFSAEKLDSSGVSSSSGSGSGSQSQ